MLCKCLKFSAVYIPVFLYRREPDCTAYVPAKDRLLEAPLSRCSDRTWTSIRTKSVLLACVDDSVLWNGKCWIIQCTFKNLHLYLKSQGNWLWVLVELYFIVIYFFFQIRKVLNFVHNWKHGKYKVSFRYSSDSHWWCSVFNGQTSTPSST